MNSDKEDMRPKRASKNGTEASANVLMQIHMPDKQGEAQSSKDRRLSQDDTERKMKNTAKVAATILGKAWISSIVKLR